MSFEKGFFSDKSHTGLVGLSFEIRRASGQRLCSTCQRSDPEAKGEARMHRKDDCRVLDKLLSGHLD